MKDYLMQLGLQALGLVLGFILTGIAGYLAKHHVKIKIAGQDVDATQVIMNVIDQTTGWGIHSADKHQDWTGEQKKQYVTNLVLQALKNLPVPIKNVDQYRPQISAAIEAALAGSDLETKYENKDQPQTTVIAEPISNAENANNDTLAKVGQTDNHEQTDLLENKNVRI